MATNKSKSTASASGSASAGLMDKAFSTSGSGMAAKKVRTSKNPTPEQQVHNALKDNFKTFTNYQCFSKQHSALTLYERLLQDKKLNIETPGAVSMGRVYYAERRLEYSDDAGPEARIAELSAVGKVQDCIFKAALALKKNPPNRGPMVECLDILQEVNETELKGIARFALDLRPSISSEQLRASIAVMKFTTRLKVAESCPKFIEILKLWFLDTAIQAHSSARANGQKPAEWLRSSRDIWSLVMDPLLVDRVMAESGCWAAVTSELQALVTQSPLGSRLFGFACKEVLGQMVKDKCEAAMARSASSGKVSEDDLRKLKISILEQLQGAPGIEELPDRREVSISYRFIGIKVKCTCLAEEVEMRLASWCRMHGLKSGVVPALLCENELVKTASQEFAPIEFDESSFNDTINARKLANGIVLAAGAKDSETILALLKGAEKRFIAADKCWKLEAAFVQGMAGSSGAEQVQNMMMALLPGANTAMDLQDVVRQAKTLLDSDVFKFMTKASQGNIAAAYDFMAKMLQGHPPVLARDSSPFVHQVFMRLPFFCRATQPAAKAGQKPVTLVGKEALKHQLASLGSKDVANLQLSELEAVQVYEFLLDKQEKASLAKLLATVTKRAAGLSKAAPAAKKVKVEQAEHSAAANMFK